MFVVGYATREECAALEQKGYEIEDATKFGMVAPFTADEGNVEDQGFLIRSQGYLMTKPEPGPNGTQAVAVFLDASLHGLLMEARELHAVDSLLDVPADKLNVEAFVKRKQELITLARETIRDAEDFKHCNHKNPDGTDARYPIGNGELACICGNRWD